MFGRLLTALQTLIRRRAVKLGDIVITHNDSGFLVCAPSSPTFGRLTVSWSDVKTVTAFKRDQYATDLMCLLFEMPGRGTLELNEDMQGWQHLIESLPNYLPDTPPWEKWWSTVAFPAFKANGTTLFDRNLPCSNSAQRADGVSHAS